MKCSAKKVDRLPGGRGHRTNDCAEKGRADPERTSNTRHRKSSIWSTSLVAAALIVATTLAQGESSPSQKILHLSLDQDQPIIVRLGTQSITTIQFPTKIEAINGYGFSSNPDPKGSDLFQISFENGTNFLSLRAVRPGASGVLNVVLEGKVYALECSQSEQPPFVMICENEKDPAAQGTGNPARTIGEFTDARLLGFLDKVKKFSILREHSPEIFRGMDISEPNSKSDLQGIEISLRRVIRDDFLNALGFEVELANRGKTDFLYDRDGFSIRIGTEIYQESFSEAGGMVPAGKTEAAFFVVRGDTESSHSDLEVTKHFDVLVRPAPAETDPQRKVSAQWQEPPDTLQKAIAQTPPAPATAAVSAPKSTKPVATAQSKEDRHASRSKDAAANKMAKNGD